MDSTSDGDRKNAQGLTEPVMNQVFKIDASKLPAYAGFMNEKNSYTIVQVSRIDNALAADEDAKTHADGRPASGDGGGIRECLW